MSAEQQSDLGAYNLCSKNKLINSPAVIVVDESEPTVAKDRPARKKEGRLLSLTRVQQKEEVKLEGGDKKIGPSLLNVTGDREKGRQAIGAEIKSYAPSINPGQLQVFETETIKAEQGEIIGLNTNLPGAYKDLPGTLVEINPPLFSPPQWGTRVVYVETGKKQLVGCKWDEPDDEPPTKRLTPTAPLLGSDTDVDSESDEDEGDSSIPLENDDGYRLVDLRLCW